MVDESSPELRLLPGDGGGRPMEFLEVSTFNLDMASFRRFDMGSRQWSVSDSGGRRLSSLAFLTKSRG